MTYLCTINYYSMKRKLLQLCLFIFIYGNSNAQGDSEVSKNVVDLSENPDIAWVLFETDAQDRNDQIHLITEG